jgi:hypothetical protein
LGQRKTDAAAGSARTDASVPVSRGEFTLDKQHILGVRRAPDMNDDAELLIVPARSVFRKLRVKMPISA